LRGSALSFAGLIHLLGIVRGLGNEGVTIRVLANFSSASLHFIVDALGAGALVIGVRGGVYLGSSRRGFGGSRGVGLRLIVIFQLGTVDVRVLTETILHSPGESVSTQ
jgi:hypothetical protein